MFVYLYEQANDVHIDVLFQVNHLFIMRRQLSRM